MRLFVIYGLRGLTNSENRPCEIILREYADHITLEAGMHSTKLTPEQMEELASQLHNLAGEIKREQKKMTARPAIEPAPPKKLRKKRVPKVKPEPAMSS